jgi:hypothetical protein
MRIAEVAGMWADGVWSDVAAQPEKDTATWMTDCRGSASPRLLSFPSGLIEIESEVTLLKLSPNLIQCTWASWLRKP